MIVSFLFLQGLAEIEQLNALEKCFLIDVLTKRGAHEEATKVVKYMQAQAEVNDAMNADQKNKVFDTVLNLNMMKNEETAHS